jgi:hypothetical protein
VLCSQVLERLVSHHVCSKEGAIAFAKQLEGKMNGFISSLCSDENC